TAQPGQEPHDVLLWGMGLRYESNTPRRAGRAPSRARPSSPQPPREARPNQGPDRGSGLLPIISLGPPPRAAASAADPEGLGQAMASPPAPVGHPVVGPPRGTRARRHGRGAGSSRRGRAPGR